MPPICPPWPQPEPLGKLRYIVEGFLSVQAFLDKKAPTVILQHGQLKDWHKRLFDKIVPVSYYAGNYREKNASRPCLEVDVHVNGRPGAPFSEVADQMRGFSGSMKEMITQTDKFFSIIRLPVDSARAMVQLAAVLSGKFIQIHPFLNGNGRISRLIVNYVSARYGYGPLYRLPENRPTNPDYLTASAECMSGNFVPLYQYLVTAFGSR